MFHDPKIAAKVTRDASVAIWPIRREMSQPRLVNGDPPCSPGTGMLHGMCHFVLGRASSFRHPFLQVIFAALGLSSSIISFRRPSRSGLGTLLPCHTCPDGVDFRSTSDNRELLRGSARN